MKKRLVITAKVYLSGREWPYPDIPPHYIDVDFNLLESLFVPESFFDYWTPIVEDIHDLSGLPIYEVYRQLREVHRRVRRRYRMLSTYYSPEELSAIYAIVHTVGVLHVDYPGINIHLNAGSCKREVPLSVTVVDAGSLLL